MRAVYVRSLAIVAVLSASVAAQEARGAVLNTSRCESSSPAEDRLIMRT